MSHALPSAVVRAMLGAAFVLGVLLPGAVHAQNREDATTEPAALMDALVDSVARRLGVDPAAVALEPLRLPAGRDLDPAVAPTLKGSGTGGLWLVELSDTQGGRFAVQMRAGVRETVAVAARALARGQVLAAADIEWSENVRFGGRPTEPPQVGWEVARAVDAGERLRAPVVRPAPVVRSGEPVTVVWSSERVRLSLDGVALATAGVGDAVTVRLSTGRRVRGVAAPGGLVRLEGGGR